MNRKKMNTEKKNEYQNVASEAMGKDRFLASFFMAVKFFILFN